MLAFAGQFGACPIDLLLQETILAAQLYVALLELQKITVLVADKCYHCIELIH